jgi:uncharacterized membrane protein (Fun14 family)
VVGSLGVGAILGWSAAYGLKTVGRMLGCLLGVAFILLQVLAYYGIVEVHWEKIAQVAPKGEALSHAASVFWKILTYNLPFTGGFAAGFWAAWRR